MTPPRVLGPGLGIGWGPGMRLGPGIWWCTRIRWGRLLIYMYIYIALYTYIYTSPIGHFLLAIPHWLFHGCFLVVSGQVKPEQMAQLYGNPQNETQMTNKQNNYMLSYMLTGRVCIYFCSSVPYWNHKYAAFSLHSLQATFDECFIYVLLIAVAT